MRNLLSKIYLCLALLTVCACSTTDKLPEGETLYTGIQSVNFIDQGDKPK